VRVKGEEFKRTLAELLADIPSVGDIRGRGFFTGIELVRDRGSKEPFPAEKALYLKIRARAFANGLICYPSGGNVDGIQGDTVILSPPYNTTDGELAEIAGRFAISLRQALIDIGA
jgi:adenosylmethionine-8-amino-7-oxononanoate aminotransferase